MWLVVWSFVRLIGWLVVWLTVWLIVWLIDYFAFRLLTVVYVFLRCHHHPGIVVHAQVPGQLQAPLAHILSPFLQGNRVGAGAGRRLFLAGLAAEPRRCVSRAQWLLDFLSGIAHRGGGTENFSAGDNGHRSAAEHSRLDPHLLAAPQGQSGVPASTAVWDAAQAASQELLHLFQHDCGGGDRRFHPQGQSTVQCDHFLAPGTVPEWGCPFIGPVAAGNDLFSWTLLFAGFEKYLFQKGNFISTNGCLISSLDHFRDCFSCAFYLPPSAYLILIAFFPVKIYRWNTIMIT